MIKNSKRIVLMLLLVFTVISVAGSASAATTNSTTATISNADNGTQGNGYSYSNPGSISDDGRYVTYGSDASNIVANDTNGLRDIFLYDTVTKTTTMITKGYDGTPSNGKSYNPVISGNGQYITYSSLASNLVAGDTNGKQDVFLYNILTGITSLVSVADNGTQGNGASSSPSISDDGTYITYQSTANNLVTNDKNGNTDIFLYNAETKTTKLISVRTVGLSEPVQTDGNSGSAQISGNGQYIVFTSYADDLISKDLNEVQDVFLYNVSTGAIIRVNVADNGTEANAAGYNPSINYDGTYITFTSTATNLVENDTNNVADVFLRDTVNKTTTRVSVASDGTPTNAACSGGSISANGRYIVYYSGATNLVVGSGSFYNVYLYDTQKGTTILLTQGYNGTQANKDCFSPFISGNGDYVVYYSDASNLVANDTNGYSDVFLTNVTPVDVYPGDDLQSIIDNATPGQIIRINDNNGTRYTYNVNLAITKLLKIIGVGNVTLTASNTSEPVITLTTGADGSFIYKLNITGATGSSGIELYNIMNAIISDLTLTGNKIGISLYNATNNTITDNNITDNNWSGICLDTSNNNTITSNTVTNNAEGIFISNSSQNTVTENTVANNTNNGINIINSSQNNITLNTVKNNTETGIFLQNSTGNTIDSGTISNNGWAGICLDNSTNNTITSSQGIMVSYNKEGAVFANNSSNNTLNGGNYQYNTNNGVNIINSNQNTIHYAAIVGNGVCGVYVKDSAYNIIDPFYINNNSWSGICLNNATNTTINSVNIENNIEGIFILDGVNNTISNNVFKNNTDTGITTKSSSTHATTANHTITGNTITQSSIGVYMEKTDYNTVSNNKITNSTWSGIYTYNLSYANITGNNITGNLEGLFLKSLAYSTITNNTITNSTYDGIAVYSDAGNTITGNNITQNKAGILLDQSQGSTVTGNTIANNTWVGICLTDNCFFVTVNNNNFENNTEQALANTQSYEGNDLSNNYWSDWTTPDTNNDGTVDTPKTIDGTANTTDPTPKTTPYTNNTT